MCLYICIIHTHRQIWVYVIVVGILGAGFPYCRIEHRSRDTLIDTRGAFLASMDYTKFIMKIVLSIHAGIKGTCKCSWFVHSAWKETDKFSIFVIAVQYFGKVSLCLSYQPTFTAKSNQTYKLCCWKEYYSHQKLKNSWIILYFI